MTWLPAIQFVCALMTLHLAGAGGLCASPVLQQDSECSKPMERQIRFEPGNRWADVESEVSAHCPDEWRVAGKTGQLLTIELLNADPDLSVSVRSPLTKDGVSELLAEGVRQWGGRLPWSGEYTIRVSTTLHRSFYGLKVSLSHIKTLGR